MNTEVIENKLNELYQTNLDQYTNECNIFKKAGFKIYRNSKGIHKVNKPQKETDYKKMFGNDVGSMFSDIFGF